MPGQKQPEPLFFVFSECRWAGIAFQMGTDANCGRTGPITWMLTPRPTALFSFFTSIWAFGNFTAKHHQHASLEAVGWRLSQGTQHLMMAGRHHPSQFGNPWRSSLTLVFGAHPTQQRGRLHICGIRKVGVAEMKTEATCKRPTRRVTALKKSVLSEP